MSAIGSEAASMLEKALEEMDDIFKQADKQPATFHSPRRSAGGGKEMGHFANIKTLMESVERFLVESNYPSGFTRAEAEELFQWASNLSYFMLFIEDAMNHLHGQTREDLIKELANVKKEKEAFLLQIGVLSTELEKSHKQLEVSNKNGKENLNDAGMHKSNHSEQPSQGLIGDKQGSHKQAQDDNTIGLKKRLREKASEVSRLKLIVDDLKASHEEKDNAISRIQNEIERLREENEQLKADGNVVASTAYSSVPKTLVQINGVSDTMTENNAETVFHGTRSTSEPNLARNGAKASGPPQNPVVTPNANGRLYHSDQRRNVVGNSFATWTMEQIGDWLEDEGMSAYIPSFTKAIARGDDVFKMTTHEMERELGISLPIHQKKLFFALKALQSFEPDYIGRLDHNWVARWLDDIGLPQYKGVFFENRVDGRVLQNLTLDDLFQLKVYATLHHTSLKRAIQCLRHQNFHPNYLKPCLTPQNEDRCNHVMLWTNGRVMDWLRSVDLAEYTPNLRGSGVHGALMILEPRFNAETLANLLAIPQSKSLLRRHLQSQFETLLSESCLKEKEITSKSSDFTPLNSSEKHKLRKRGPFGTLRRRKSELELDQNICPLELRVPECITPPPALDPDDVFEFSDTLSSPAVSNDHDCSAEVGMQPKSMGEFSHEITNLTALLQQSR